MTAVPRWELGSLLRLLGGVVVCLLLGSVLALVVSSPIREMEHGVRFALAAIAAAVSLLGALGLVSRPWPTERVRRNGLAFFALLYLAVFLSAMAQRLAGTPPGEPSLAQVVIPTLCWQGAVLWLIGRMIREHGLRWSEAFGLTRAPGRAMTLGAGAVLAALPVLWTVQLLSVMGLSWLGWTPHPQTAVNLFAGAEGWPERFLLAVITVVLAPVCEELVFRGVLYPALKQTGWVRPAFWITALVFALVHFHVETFLPLLAFACLLNVLYDRTGNLLACIAAHAVFNGVNLGAILVMQRWFPEQLQM